VERRVNEEGDGLALRVLARLLAAIAIALGAITLLSIALHGLQLSLGPIRISATDPARVALQAALVWLVAVVVNPAIRVRRGVVMASLTAVLIAASADSNPRRVGDGAEYLVMALNLSRLHPPALSVDEKRELVDRLAVTPGFRISTLDQPLVGADGRQDFPHFWLYPLVVAPVLAVVNGLGLHPNHAFTIVNGLLLLLLSWWFVKGHRAIAAALLVAGPLIWWIDKAHAEVFLFIMIAGAIVIVDHAPVLALVAAGLAAAQNSGALVVLAGLAIYVLVYQRRNATFIALAAAVAMAALPPLYYVWHLGTWSPLAETVERGMPGLRAVLTALIDLNLGLVPYAPLLVVLALVGIKAQRRRTLVLVAALFATLLIVLSRPLNLNHGGSPGISRYALWLLACLTPLVAHGAESLERRRPLLMAIFLMTVVAMSWYSFRPEAVDRGGGTPSMGATMVWTRWPSLENPLPEVFAERASGVDGEPPVPIAISDCRKILIRGDGSETWWPFPCDPREAPPECVAANALCYVNGDRFAIAPRQPSFHFDPAAELSWTMSARGRLPVLQQRLGGGVRFVRLGNVRRTDGGEALLPLIVEGRTGTAVWVRPLAASAFLRVRVSVPSTIELQRAISGDVVSTAMVAPGNHTVSLPFDERMLVLILDAS
jgi:hypothetical protein